MSMMRVVTFNDEPLLSAALTSILRDAGDIDLLALVARVDGVVPAVLDRQPDILLLSLTSEVHAGMIRQLRQASPNCRIVLWVHSIASELAHQAMEIGVRGILRRTCPADMVLKCLRKVHEGELWFDQSLTSSFLACRKVRLTRREAQLVHLLAEGLKLPAKKSSFVVPVEPRLLVPGMRTRVPLPPRVSVVAVNCVVKVELAVRFRYDPAL